MGSEHRCGLLVSQIGYDLDEQKHAVFRHSLRNGFPDAAEFALVDLQTDKTVFTGSSQYWGEIWGAYWWILDFTPCSLSGAFAFQIQTADQHYEEEIRIGENLLWNETVETVALKQFEQRAEMARNGIGWKDCGADWREANSHAASIIGLCDLQNIGYEWLGRENADRLMDQIIHGCDYLCLCQQRAADLGLPDGALAHELPNHAVIIPQDQGQAVVALSKAARLVYEVDRERGMLYLDAAACAYDFLIHQCQPSRLGNFSHLSHGAPKEYLPNGFMTNDLIMMAWGGVELYASGCTEYQNDAIAIMEQILARQVPESAAEDGLFGHFYTFDDHAFTEKAFMHHHVGHDTGVMFSHYVAPLLRMVELWGEHPHAKQWRKALKDFAFGYFLPACQRNPFNLMPNGIFTDEGLLSFCGPWHGFNGCYGFAASLAAQFLNFFDDERFRAVATGNLQWLAGLNAGITAESLTACQFWREEIPEGEVRSFSQIYGIGKQWAQSWSKIPGSIPNGFATNLQFQLKVEPRRENDAPRYYTDEDWIPHAGGFLSGLANLRIIKRWRWEKELI